MLFFFIFEFRSDDSKDSAIEDDLWRFETVRGHNNVPGFSATVPDDLGTLRLKPTPARQDILPLVREELPQTSTTEIQRTSSKLVKERERDSSPVVKRPVSMPPITRTPDDMPPPLPAKQRNSSLKVQ